MSEVPLYIPLQFEQDLTALIPSKTPGAFAGTAAVRCDVAAPAITGAKLVLKM